MPDAAGPGTLITLAPGALSIDDLTRLVQETGRVGVTRVLLDALQPDGARAASILREQLGVIVAREGLDQAAAGFIDVEVEVTTDLPGLAAEVARLVADHPTGISIRGLGPAELPALLTTLAVGGHVTVGPAASVREQISTVARAAGLARLAGRPPLTAAQAWARLGTGQLRSPNRCRTSPKEAI